MKNGRVWLCPIGRSWLMVFFFGHYFEFPFRWKLILVALGRLNGNRWVKVKVPERVVLYQSVQAASLRGRPVLESTRGAQPEIMIAFNARRIYLIRDYKRAYSDRLFLLVDYSVSTFESWLFSTVSSGHVHICNGSLCWKLCCFLSRCSCQSTFLERCIWVSRCSLVVGPCCSYFFLNWRPSARRSLSVVKSNEVVTV